MCKKLAILLAAILFLNCRMLNESEHADDTMYPFTGADMAWVDSVYSTMTQDEKIGQLFMVAAYSNPKQQNTSEITRLIRDYHIGGLIFMKGSPMIQAQLTNTYQEMSKCPLAIAIDGEWGLAMRLDSTVSFPRQLQLGALDKSNEHLIDEMGVEIGRQCVRMGIHINFAPVVDINTNPKNPVINTRSFGEDKENVTAKALLYMEGMQSQNILTTAKHFPGHGNTNNDSHYTLPVIQASRETIETFELYPYKKMIQNNLTGVMVAHLFIPSLDKTKNLPSTLSSKIVKDKLRNDLHFQGLIFTDALNMKAVSATFPSGEAEVRAIEAGNDVLLYTLDVDKAFTAIKHALATGRLKQADIDEHCRRILIAKSWMKVYERNHVDLNHLQTDLQTVQARNLNRRLVQASITVAKDENKQLPLKQLDTKKIAVVSLRPGDSYFISSLKKQAPVTRFTIPVAQSDYQSALQTTIEQLSKYNVVIIDVPGSSSYPSKKYGITSAMVDVVGKIAAQNTVIMVLHANPYALDYFKEVLPNVETLVVSYDFRRLSQEVVPEVLFGALPATGHLPVSAGGLRAGTGVSYGSIGRLRDGEPIEVGLSEEKLQDIDSVVNTFIGYGAMPGCQVLVAKDGVVVYEKAFGTYAYDIKDSVTTHTIYDLASITKSAATAVSLMKLYDDNKFSLEKTFGDYLSPQWRGTWKDSLFMKDVLTHQAGLRAGVSTVPTFIKDYNEKGMKSAKRSSKYPYRLDKNLYIRSDYSFIDSAIVARPDSNHTIEVAENVYMLRSYRDTVFRLVIDSRPNLEPGVLYSDLGFYLMTDVVANIAGEPLDVYTEKNFYKKLGASTLGYCPRKRFSLSEIAPTETDEFFRRQLLRGYVHDRGAAILGGVSGHAGLFSDARDLAKLMQMLLNKGYYGGERYLQASTVDLFTSCPYCENGNRKGYGFDKPEPDGVKLDPTCHCTSPLSYGHTGFTGTLFWVDPEKNIVYIFLSNRVNRQSPDASNTMLGDSAVRPRIQKIIYEAIL